MTLKAVTAFLLVSQAMALPVRLFTFESDKNNDITGQFGRVADQVDAIATNKIRAAKGFLASRKDRLWLARKIETEKQWKDSRAQAFEAFASKEGVLTDGAQVIKALLHHMDTKEKKSIGADDPAQYLLDAKDWLEPCQEESECADALFARVDLDQDHKVSAKEFHDYVFDSIEDEMRLIQRRANRKVLKSLQTADKNKDGIVSEAEADAWFNEMDFAVKGKSRPSYAELDENKDGQVSKAEFNRQLLNLVGDAQTFGPTKTEMLEGGEAALELGAKLIEEGSRARKGFWNAYALKRMAEQESQVKGAGGKVN